MKIYIEKDEDMPDETRYVVDLYEYLETPYIEREEALKNVGCPAYLDSPKVRKFIIESLAFFIHKYDKDGKHICLNDDEEDRSDPHELRMSAGDDNMISFEIVYSRDSSKMTFMVDEFRLMNALTEIMRLKHTG